MNTTSCSSCLKLPNQTLIPIGRIARPHATRGGLAFTWNNDLIDNPCTILPEISKGLFLFLKNEKSRILQHHVPFQVEQFREFPNGTSVLYFTRIATPEEANTLIGATVYIEEDKLPTYTDEELVREQDLEKDGILHIQSLIGKTILDQEMNTIGTVTGVNDYAGSIVLEVSTISHHTPTGNTNPDEHRNASITPKLIPFHPDLIHPDQHLPIPEHDTLRLILPDGLLDL